MGESASGKTVFWLTVYFIFFIVGLTLIQVGLESAGIEYSFVTNNDESILGDVIVDGFTCSGKRVYTADDGDIKSISRYQQNSLLCSWTDGRISEASCNSIVGCSWVDTSTIFFFFTRDAYCDGNVNITEYNTNYNTTIYSYFKTTSSVHEPETIYIVSGATPQYLNYKTGQVQQDVCFLAEDSRTCNMLGCSWVDANELTDDISIGVIMDITGALFTFNVTFTDDYWTNLLLTLILFYIPLISYIIAIYFALPFIH